MPVVRSAIHYLSQVYQPATALQVEYKGSKLFGEDHGLYVRWELSTTKQGRQGIMECLKKSLQFCPKKRLHTLFINPTGLGGRWGEGRISWWEQG